MATGRRVVDRDGGPKAIARMGAERIAKVGVLNYIGLVYALIFGIAIFGEHYTAQTGLGGILLVVVG